MAFWFLLVLASLLFGAHTKIEGIYVDYLGKDQTNSVKGFFILIVILIHSLKIINECGYPFNGMVEHFTLQFLKRMGQLIVVMFFFYSGYGVTTSLLHKGDSYLHSFLKKRYLSTLLNFDIAVCVYLFCTWALGNSLGLKDIALSFIGWKDIGNDCWFIFIILFCYLSFYLSFNCFRLSYIHSALFLFILIFVGMLVLHDIKPRHWYNTMLVFSSGVFFAIYKGKIESVIESHYPLVFITLLCLFLILHFGRFSPMRGLTYNLKSIVFSLLVVTTTMKVHFGNRWLSWCGTHLFPMYLYQRLPMTLLLSALGQKWISGHPNVFLGASFLLTIGISFLINRYLRIQLA